MKVKTLVFYIFSFLTRDTALLLRTKFDLKASPSVNQLSRPPRFRFPDSGVVGRTELGLRPTGRWKNTGIGKKGVKTTVVVARRGPFWPRARGVSPAPRFTLLALRDQALQPSVTEDLASFQTPSRVSALCSPEGVCQAPLAPP